MHLSIIGGGEGKFELLQKLTEANVPYRDYGMVFDVKELQEILSSCHFGLNMYKSTTCIGLTMKSCDYINAELPIINSNIYDTGILVEKYQSGFNISNEKYNVELTRLLELSDEQYKNMKRQAKKMKEELFLAESKKEEFKNIFKSIVEFKKTNDE